MKQIYGYWYRTKSNSKGKTCETKKQALKEIYSYLKNRPNSREHIVLWHFKKRGTDDTFMVGWDNIDGERKIVYVAGYGEQIIQLKPDGTLGKKYKYWYAGGW